MESKWLATLGSPPGAEPEGAEEEEDDEEEEEEEEEGAEFLSSEAVRSTYCSLILAILSSWFCCRHPMACLWSLFCTVSISCSLSYFLWMLEGGGIGGCTKGCGSVGVAWVENIDSNNWQYKTLNSTKYLCTLLREVGVASIELWSILIDLPLGESVCMRVCVCARVCYYIMQKEFNIAVM